MNSVILFFVDGLGIGARGLDNPLHLSNEAGPLAYFVNEECDPGNGGVMIPTDATLGVEGRPQSASGQTTILTGVNAAKHLGRHKQGFPNEQLRALIRKSSIFKQLNEAGIGPNLFANTYTPQFFESTPRWKSATTVAVESAGLGFRKLPDLLGRRSVFHDFTNRSLIERGFDVPEFAPADAAEILVQLAETHRFVLYEHFITDKIGHDRDMGWALRHIPELAKFLAKTVEFADLERTTVILTSDHGNIENLSVRNHTLNQVPTVVWGRKSSESGSRIQDLTDLSPLILDLLNK